MIIHWENHFQHTKYTVTSLGGKLLDFLFMIVGVTILKPKLTKKIKIQKTTTYGEHTSMLSIFSTCPNGEHTRMLLTDLHHIPRKWISKSLFEADWN